MSTTATSSEKTNGRACTGKEPSEEAGRRHRAEPSEVRGRRSRGRARGHRTWPTTGGSSSCALVAAPVGALGAGEHEDHRGAPGLLVDVVDARHLAVAIPADVRRIARAALDADDLDARLHEAAGDAVLQLGEPLAVSSILRPASGAHDDDAVEPAELAAERLHERRAQLADEPAAEHHLDAGPPAEVVEQRGVLRDVRVARAARALGERVELDVLAHDRRRAPGPRRSAAAPGGSCPARRRRCRARRARCAGRAAGRA